MTISALTNFFMWCTIINGGLLIFWSLFILITPGLVYRLQNTFFPMPRETYNVVMYCFLGFFKVMFIIFNVVPFIALLILNCGC